MLRIPLFAVAVFFLLIGAGCTTPNNRATQEQSPNKKTETSIEPGQIAYDFPIQKETIAKPGEYVLTIPRTWIDESFEDPAGSLFIYYPGKMITPGIYESEIERLSGEKMMIPNSLIIPLPETRVKKGDMILTWWQSGSGMTRALVVGGSASEPEVLYLDHREYNPADAPEKLLSHSFTKIVSSNQFGTTLACKQVDEKDFYRYQIVNSTEDTVLLLGWAGEMLSMKKDRCTSLPVNPEMRIGEEVYVPLYGKFTPGKITKIDHSIGRITVAYSFAGQEETITVPFGDIALDLGGE